MKLRKFTNTKLFALQTLQERNILSFAKYFLFILTAAIFSIPAHAQIIDPNLPIISYVNFQSVDPVQSLTVSGQLRVPPTEDGERIPAVVIVHGSAGVDSRGKFYTEALNGAGIATLEIDMWASRGWIGGITGRPQGVPETLPDAYGALKFLSEQPRIDPERIGIMGFSWGGVVTMLTATDPYTSQYTDGTLKFAAHIAHYPVCWVYNLVPGYAFNDFTGSPLLIQAGELDAYDEPDTCLNLAQSLSASAQAFISVKVYANVTHAWDRLQPAITVSDPYSHMGLGGQVKIVPNPGKAFQSRSNALGFFQETFGMAH